MIEHGSIRIRRKISIQEFFEAIEKISKEMGEGYNLTYGSVDVDGYFIGPHKPFIEGNEVVVGVNKHSSVRVHLGTRVAVIVCRNMQRKITLLVIRKQDDAPEDAVNTIVEKLLLFTGGKFNAGLRC